MRESHNPWLAGIGSVLYAAGLGTTLFLVVRRSWLQVQAGGR